MKIPTPRGTQPRTTTPAITAERVAWWIEPLQLLVLAAATIAVFQLAGGNWNQVATWFTAALTAPDGPARLHMLATPPTPLGLALITMFAVAAVGNLADLGARQATRRHFHRWHAPAHHEDVLGEPDTVPPGEQTPAAVVERAVQMNGPIHWVPLIRLLHKGGPHGAPLAVSQQAVVRMLRGADWLKPRRSGEPYEHVPVEDGAEAAPR